MNTYICSASIESHNPSFTLRLDGSKFIQREYRAKSLESAKKGFIQYLNSNKELIGFSKVLIN